MENKKRLVDANALRTQFDDIPPFIGMTGGLVQQYIDKAPTVDTVEVVHIEKVKQEILETFDVLIDTHRDISESSNDYYGIYAAAMEIARRLVNAALTDLCDNCGAKMDGERSADG